jgi:putative addiction module component (TIGR02574 family)
MPMSLDEIEKEALALPSEARAHLADRLVESLGSADASTIDQLWAAEAKRRRDEVREGRVRTIPGPEGLARVRRNVQR